MIIYLYAVPILFGGAEVIIEEIVVEKSKEKIMDGEENKGDVSPHVVMMVNDKVMGTRQQQCAKFGEACFPEAGVKCCQGLVCGRVVVYPPVAGTCASTLNLM